MGCNYLELSLLIVFRFDFFISIILVYKCDDDGKVFSSFAVFMLHDLLFFFLIIVLLIFLCFYKNGLLHNIFYIYARMSFCMEKYISCVWCWNVNIAIQVMMMAKYYLFFLLNVLYEMVSRYLQNNFLIIYNRT